MVTAERRATARDAQSGGFAPRRHAARWRAWPALSTIAWVLAAAPAPAQTASEVAVVINENSAASFLVGEHYVKARGIPPSNVFRLRTATDDTIEREAFVTTIEQPLAVAPASIRS